MKEQAFFPILSVSQPKQATMIFTLSQISDDRSRSYSVAKFVG